MIKVDENGVVIEGDDFEIYTNLTALHAVIIKEPILMKHDQLAMAAVKKALEGFLDELFKKNQKESN
jgi:hypothetical protein